MDFLDQTEIFLHLVLEDVQIVGRSHIVGENV